MNTAEVIQIETAKAVQLFDIAESVFQEIESYTALQITDTKTEKDVRKARQDVRGIRYQIQNRQKELNADLNQKKRDYKEAAESLIERLVPTETDLDAKIKAVEAEREAKRLEKERIETERLESINAAIACLSMDCESGLRYGRESEKIKADLAFLENFEIQESVFQERTEEAHAMLGKGIEQTKQALESRQKFEQEQEELRLAQEAQAKAEAEAKVKREAEEKRLAAEREKLEAERRAAEAETRKKAEAEAEKQRLAAEKIQKEREALEAERAKLAAEEKARKDAELFAQEYAQAWNEAHIFDARVNACIERGNAENEAIRQAELKAEAERLEALKPDKEKLQDYALKLSEIPEPELTTDDGKDYLRAVNGHLRNAIDVAMEFAS